MSYLHFCQKLMDFFILNFILWQIENEFSKLMQIKIKLNKLNNTKMPLKITKSSKKIHGNAFPKSGNAFAEFRNAFAKFMKMHLQNPFKCICKIHNFFWICNFANAFPKSKVENAFFSRVGQINVFFIVLIRMTKIKAFKF